MKWAAMTQYSQENRQALQQLTGHVSSVEKLSSSIQAEQTEKSSVGNNK